MPLGDPQTRLETAVAILNELGGMVALEMCDDQYCIRGYSCPLAAAVPGHPEVCRCAETFLTELIELPIQAQCDASETPQCCFVVQTT